MTKAKICGLTNADDALCAAAEGADALGFIFYERSPRYVSPETVGEIVKELPPFVARVGVFVNETRDTIERIADSAGLTALQLHGDETPADCSGFSRSVVRVLRVSDRLDPEEIQPYADAGVTTFMLDTAKQGLYGGTGETFDWAVATSAKAYGRVILSGGMTADNVAAGIATVDPYAVDIGSGVEREPGIKDHGKVKAFLTAVRESRES